MRKSRLITYNFWEDTLEEYILDDILDASVDTFNNISDIKSKDRILLGRRYDQDIVFCLETISRTHGEFVRKSDGWYYQDNFGKNGTLLNGTYLTSENADKLIKLNTCDVFNFGADGTKTSLFPDCRSIWAMFSDRECDAISQWHTFSFESFSIDDVYSFVDGDRELIWPTELTKNSVYAFETGSAIYTGKKLFISGDVRIKM